MVGGTADLTFSFYSVPVHLNNHVQQRAPGQCGPNVSLWTADHSVALLREARLSSGRENFSKKMLLAPPEVSRAKQGRYFSLREGTAFSSTVIFLHPDNCHPHLFMNQRQVDSDLCHDLCVGTACSKCVNAA